MSSISRSHSADNLLQDFSRLTLDLPTRPKYSKRVALEEFSSMTEQMDKGEFTWPKTATINTGLKNLLSETIDGSVLRVYNNVVHQVQATSEHKKNLRALLDAPKTCGGFKEKTAILTNATPLEQMIALDHLIDAKSAAWQKGARTLCFGTKDKDDLIPIYLLSKNNVPASTMTTRLGTGSRGKFKVPKYDELADNANLAKTSPFATPLEALEVVRQPYFSGATLLKGNAFLTGTIDAHRRYEILDPKNATQNSQFTCVEPKKQNDPKLTPTKSQSAGANLLSLEKKSPSKSITKKLRFEEFAPEGYKDDVVLQLKSKDYWSSVRHAIIEEDTTELDRQTTILFLSKFGKFSSDVVNKYYADTLFEVKEK
ncbi:MAG: hypothetical protein JSR58_07395 [Verrucomicrobia bacterium]|nr:hypothetical protein [Verrucomicrobiota bacterium]